MSDSKFKVTDKRMFTADGTLREEYRFLEEEGGSPGAVAQTSAAAASEAPAEPPPAAPIPSPEEDAFGEVDGPSILDLLMMLAEPASIYLGDVRLPDGSTQENLDLAQLHIQLIDILKQKTRGNLSAQEAAVMDDILERLKMRYVQKRG